jgi:ATP-dependent protease Clp ATPase subunit
MNDGLRCSFCQRSQREVRKLVVGRNASICDGCLPQAREALSLDDPVGLPCGFCGKRVDARSRRRKSRGLDGVAIVGGARICRACLDLSDAIVEEAVG